MIPALITYNTYIGTYGMLGLEVSGCWWRYAIGI